MLNKNETTFVQIVKNHYLCCRIQVTSFYEVTR
jgi:hypothetical protein